MQRLLGPVLLCALALSACQSGEKRLEGERQAVLPERPGIAVDPATAQAAFELPSAKANAAWPQAGFNVANRVPHVALERPLATAWQADLAGGNASDRRLATRPVVADGRVYTLDSAGAVSAYKLATGERVWRRRIAPAVERGLFGLATPYLGGGLAVAETYLFAAGAHGEVVQLAAGTGEIVKRRSLPTPVHAAPKLAPNRLLLRSVDNRLLAYSLGAEGMGDRVWQHQGVAEPAQVLAGGTPSFAGGRAVVGYSTGQLYGLTAANGRAVWQRSLKPGERGPTERGVRGVAAAPVIANGTVYAVGHGGTTAAIDVATGQERWRLPAGGRSRVQLMGGYLAVLTNESVVLGVSRDQGEVRWRHELPRFDDPQNRDERIAWFGPVLAGGRLWLAGSNGQLVGLAPADGTARKRVALGGSAVSPPVVADGTLLVLTGDGTLRALR